MPLDPINQPTDWRMKCPVSLNFEHIFCQQDFTQEEYSCGNAENLLRSSHSVMSIVLDYDIRVTEFKVRSFFYVHFGTNEHGNIKENPTSVPAVG